MQRSMNACDYEYNSKKIVCSRTWKHFLKWFLVIASYSQAFMSSNGSSSRIGISDFSLKSSNSSSMRAMFTKSRMKSTFGLLHSPRIMLSGTRDNVELALSLDEVSRFCRATWSSEGWFLKNNCNGLVNYRYHYFFVLRILWFHVNSFLLLLAIQITAGCKILLFFCETTGKQICQ